jgi:hypothetical protein
MGMFVRRGYKLKLLLNKYQHHLNKSLMLQKAVDQMLTNTTEYEYAMRDLVNAKLDCQKIDQLIFQTFLEHKEDEQIRANQRDSDGIE